MSKFYQKQNKSQSQVSVENLKPLQFDVTIEVGKVERAKSSPFDSFLGSMAELLEQMEELGLLELDEEDSQARSQEIEEFEAKVRSILGNKNLDVNARNLTRYLNYLEKNIQKPCFLTGIEPFNWEEEYLLGSGSQREYERAKKTNPSYTDIFTLSKFDKEIIETEGVLVEVKRVSDRKSFTLPLADLEATDESSPNYQFLEDYSTWFCNYY